MADLFNEVHTQNTSTPYEYILLTTLDLVLYKGRWARQIAFFELIDHSGIQGIN